MNAVAKALWNPIVAKEYRTRMRTWRSPVAITIYIVLLGGIGWAVFSATAATQANNVIQTSPGGLGSQLFTFLVLFQVALIAFMTPALTAGAISGERERQTLDLLFVTPIRPFSIIWGKLLASISFIVLLLVISVPLFSLVFLFGGVELDQVLEAFLVTAVTAMTLGFVGVAFSAFFRRSLAATVGAYGAAFILLVGTLVYGFLFPTVADPNSSTIPAAPAITFISPALPLVTIATGQPIPNYGYRYDNGPNGYLQATSTNGGSCGTGPNGVVICKGASGIVQATSGGTAIPTGMFKGWQYWQASIVMQIVISGIALAFAAYLLPPVRRLRLGPRVG